jgi:PEP-CTERM/exosortase A-associated glycosyltransferase
MRILHVFDHSLPLQSGYVTRSQAILQSQRARGWETRHLTSPRHQLFAGGEADSETIDGLTFHRTPYRRIGVPVAREIMEMRATGRRIAALARAVRPDVIHAHSPVLDVIPALAVGRRLNIPVVYEVRALWEDAGADHGRGGEQSLRYRMARWLDSQAMRRTDRIVALCEPLREEIVARGIAPNRVSVVPNAVDPRFLAETHRPDPELRRSLGLDGATVLGFIGSFYAYEGLDLLIEAMKLLASRRDDLAMLFVGGGPEQQRLRDMVADNDLQRRIRFVDRVKMDEVFRYYALVDMLVFPRRRMRLTDLVTPLKPLEAMAQSRPVLASDVGGHRELIRHDDTGLLFPPDDPGLLAAAIDNALADPARLARIVANGRRFVETERNWTAVCERYVRLYEDVLSEKQALETA